jgi:DUF4097 and DUF4098 domain-containing protein YvlB
MQEFDRTTPVTVALRAHRGTVDITAADDATVQVDVVPLDGSEAAADAARNTRVSLDGDTLTVQTPETSGWRWHRAARLGITIRVPTGSSLAAKTGSADLRAAGRYATVQVSTASGDVWLEEATGSAHIEAASGDLSAGRIGGALRIGSSSGDVEVGDVTSDVTAKSASGDITIRSVGGSATADTASGDLQIGLVRRGQCRLSSASGDIEVGVAAGTGVWLDVSTASGDTVNELRMSGTPGLGTPTTGTSDEAQSGAALELRVRTASGDIHIRRVTGDVPAAA